jgi:hypothetical protein
MAMITLLLLDGSVLKGSSWLAGLASGSSGHLLLPLLSGFLTLFITFICHYKNSSRRVLLQWISVVFNIYKYWLFFAYIRFKKAVIRAGMAAPNKPEKQVNHAAFGCLIQAPSGA